MNRNQIFTTIEFVDDLVRMCIGEYYNEKFYIFDTFKCQCSGLEASNIINKEEVKNTILDLVELIKEKDGIVVEEFILCMPSNDLIINDFASTSPVTSTNHLISQYDINEAHKMAAKIRHQDYELIIGICPIEYQLEDNQRMDSPPLKYKSATFKTLFKVYMLPTEIYDTYFSVITECCLKVSKYYLDIDCLYAGIYEEDDISASILNIDKYSTNLLLYKKGNILEKISVPYGTFEIEKEIEKKLLIKDKKEIKNLVYNVGSSIVSENNYLTVCKNKEGRYISEKQLNEIIEQNMKDIFASLFNKIKKEINISDLDICITGYGANIKGTDKLLNKMYNCNAKTFVSTALGLYNSGYCQTIGLLKLNYKKISQNKYINIQNDSYNDIITKESSSKFDKFILNDDELD